MELTIGGEGGIFIGVGEEGGGRVIKSLASGGDSPLSPVGKTCQVYFWSTVEVYLKYTGSILEAYIKVVI